MFCLVKLLMRIMTKPKTQHPPRSQAQRRAETSSLVLQSATALFAEKGYKDCSLEEIARAAGTTIRPIYHYYSSKKELFTKVVEQQEQRLVKAIESRLTTPNKSPLSEGWEAFTTLADDKAFRQTVLLDAPNILGRERWAGCAVTLQANKLLKTHYSKLNQIQAELIPRIVMASLAEAALILAEAHSKPPKKQAIHKEIQALFHQITANFEL